MPHAKLTITLPESIWIGDVSRTHPEIRFRIQAATANDADGVARVDVIDPNATDVCEEITEYEAVTDLTVFVAEEGKRRVQIETTEPLLMQSLQDAGVPLDTPVEIVNGSLTLEATVPQRNLSKLGSTLDDFGIDYRVERIQQELEAVSLLTDRQEWLLEQAIDRGYYDTPRQTSLVELAEELDLAKSTASEMLHRAEERVLKEYTDDGTQMSQALVARAD
jgi:predicted DNA binding protein